MIFSKACLLLKYYLSILKSTTSGKTKLNSLRFPESSARPYRLLFSLTDRHVLVNKLN